jgi:hypothetical protein
MARSQRAANAEARGMFLPGVFVEDERTNQRGTVIVPSAAALGNMPDDNSVFVRWYLNDRETWVEAGRLRRVDRL